SLQLGLLSSYVVKTNQFIVYKDQLVCSPGCLLGHCYYGFEYDLGVPRARMIQWNNKYLYYVYGIQHALPSPPSLLLQIRALTTEEFSSAAEHGKFYIIVMPNIHFQASLYTINKPYWTRFGSDSSSSSALNNSSSSAINNS